MWLLNPTVCRRIEDDTFWTPTGDSPFPLEGYNFTRIEKCKIGWKTIDARWLFIDASDFEVVK